MDKDEIQKRKGEIAAEIMDIAVSTLLVNMRFMGAAFAMLGFERYGGTIATDARKIYYNPDHIIKLYKAGREETVRAYLHTVLHCLFRHPFSLADARYWNLACDIAVEAIIGEWGLPCTDVKTGQRRCECAQIIKDETRFLTAEKIYAYLKSKRLPEQTLRSLEQLFVCDDHSNWGYKLTANIVLSPQKTSGGGGSKTGDMGNSPADMGDLTGNEGSSNGEDFGGDGGSWGRGGQKDGFGRDDVGGPTAEDLNREWKELSERIQTDLETFSAEWGKKSGSMVMALKEVNREKYNYETFLKKFSVLTEAVKINQDEFDYVFYTLGLKLYGNMPLVEPLEYRDVKQIREFAIAIDTSGSVAGEKVQAFIRKTYNILKQQESYAKKINIHIIQCDAEVQKDTKITALDELEKYFSDMKLYGFGGTDFRPVFKYVDKLIEQGEFTNLKGLIYFTDGYGTFPEGKPRYDTAFVFVDDSYNNYDVPPWAIRLVLDPADI